MHNLVKQQQQQEASWKPTFGEDSLEIAPDELFDQSDLAERMSDAEKKFSTSSIYTSHFASEYFEHPALYRVLFMGSVTEEKKKELFKKLSQGFVHVLQQQQHHLRTTNKNLSLLGQPIIPFKEIKHNVLLLSDDDNDPQSDICEDIGVSMIEADFTWNSNAINYSNDPNNLLLQYAWHQCPNPRELPSAWLENQIFKSKFTGYMLPEVTPNGIDLCVYFYDGPSDEERTKDDLELLCLLRKLGVYVLPLTTTRDETIKSHFADLLTEYKVRCLDLGNLEVGQEPSFFHKTDRLARLQGMECTQLNVPRVATYQILAVDQFCGIENNAIFQLLKRTRERQVIRDEIKEELQRRNTRATEDDTTEEIQLTNTENSLESLESLDTPSVVKKQRPRKNTASSEITTTVERKGRFTTALSVIVLLSSLAVGLYFTQEPIQQWTVSFDLDPVKEATFTFTTKDQTGHLRWPEQAPQVWLNNAQRVPFQRVKESPGQYQLVLDPFLEHQQQKFISLAFHINTTVHNIMYNPTSNTNYVLLNTNYNRPKATSTKPSSTARLDTKTTTPRQPSQQRVNTDDLSFLTKTWRLLVFVRYNYSNLGKIVIKK